MKPWNRFSSFIGRIVAGHDGRREVNDAIFLNDTAYRNHQPVAAAAPDIRERHFGAGIRNVRDSGNLAAGKTKPAGAGWLSRLGLGQRAAALPETEHVRTKIVGTPHPASGEKKTQAMASRKEETAPPAPALAGSMSAPARAAPARPVGSAGLQTTAAPAASRPGSAHKALGDDVLEDLFGKPEPVRRKPLPALDTPIRTVAPVVVARKKKRLDRSDVTLAALGLTLGLICAIFPWYIFFNQEKFGVREFVFSGKGSGRATPTTAYVPQAIGKPFASGERPTMELDFFPTATLPPEDEPARALPASEQPFPSDRVSFRLVHVANGRAMIEDGDGLWVVQRGSQLPDASRVASIEQRDGRWVLLTTQDKVVELSN